MRTSVLINTHDHAPYIADCVDSVLAQTRPPDEVIVYDDGSTDGTVAALRSHRGIFTLIEGRKQPGEAAFVGQGRAIAEAFRRSTGEVVFLLDGDDLFAPTKIARFCEAFAATPRAVLVQAPMRWIDGSGAPLARMLEPFRHVSDPLAASYARHDCDRFYSTSALAFARSFLDRQLPIDWSDGIALWSDVRLTCAALFAGPIVTLPDELGAWRRHQNSDSIRQSGSGRYLAQLTWQRTRLFNRFASDAGRQTLSLWRNRRFYLQCGRMLLPWLGDHLARSRRPAAEAAQMGRERR